MRVFSAFVLFGILLAVFQPVFAQENSDDLIYDRVRQRLAASRDVRAAIDVDVKDAVVTLRGRVTEERQKNKAEKVARKTKGVKKVVNEIRVESPTKPSSST
jgi:osmotically-inducible protein OsmY